MLLNFDRVHDHLEKVYCLNLLPAKRFKAHWRVHKFFQCALLPARPIKDEKGEILEARPRGFIVQNKRAMSVCVRPYRLGQGRGRVYKLYITENKQPTKQVMVFNMRGIDSALEQWEMEHYDKKERKYRATWLEKARAKRDKEEAKLLKKMRKRVLFSP
jgi:hypothetical protein